MSFNSLGDALKKAQKNSSTTAKILAPTPVTRRVEPELKPKDPPLRKVEGGTILRKPVNRQAAMIIAPARWWDKPPYVPPPPPEKGKTIPELELRIKSQAESIQQLQRHCERLRVKLNEVMQQHDKEMGQGRLLVEQQKHTIQQLETKVHLLDQKLKVAELWSGRHDLPPQKHHGLP